MVAVVAAVGSMPAALRPVKKTPPGANRSITDEGGSVRAGIPSRNSWPTRARGVIASRVACAQDTGGVRGGCVRAGGVDLRVFAVGAGAAGSGVTAQAIATAQAATAPLIRSPRSTATLQHGPASAVQAPPTSHGWTAGPQGN